MTTDPFKRGDPLVDQIEAAIKEAEQYHSRSYAFSSELQRWVGDEFKAALKHPERETVALASLDDGPVTVPATVPIGAVSVIQAGEHRELVLIAPARVRDSIANTILYPNWRCDCCRARQRNSPILRIDGTGKGCEYGSLLTFARGTRLLVLAVCGRCRRRLDRRYPEGLRFHELREFTAEDALAFILGPGVPK